MLTKKSQTRLQSSAGRSAMSGKSLPNASFQASSVQRGSQRERRRRFEDAQQLPDTARATVAIDRDRISGREARQARGGAALPRRSDPHRPRRRARPTGRTGPIALQYGATEGIDELRHLVAHGFVDHPGCGSPGDVVVTTGSQQAIDLVARVLLDPGDVVAVEDPLYLGARQVLGGTRRHSWPSRSTGRGLRTDVLADHLRRGTQPQFVYVVPHHQNPTGATLPPERRVHLVELAEHYGFFVVEDDPYRALGWNPPAHPRSDPLPRTAPCRSAPRPRSSHQVSASAGCARPAPSPGRSCSPSSPSTCTPPRCPNSLRATSWATPTSSARTSSGCGGAPARRRRSCTTQCKASSPRRSRRAACSSGAPPTSRPGGCSRPRWLRGSPSCPATRSAWPAATDATSGSGSRRLPRPSCAPPPNGCAPRSGSRRGRAAGTLTGMSRALVTGATGFVGRALVRRLLADGWSVDALVRHADAELPPGVTAPRPRRRRADRHSSATRPDPLLPSGHRVPRRPHRRRHRAHGRGEPRASGPCSPRPSRASRRCGSSTPARSGSTTTPRRTARCRSTPPPSRPSRICLVFYAEVEGLAVHTMELMDTYGRGDTRAKLIPFLLRAGIDGHDASDDRRHAADRPRPRRRRGQRAPRDRGRRARHRPTAPAATAQSRCASSSTASRPRPA